MSIDASAPAYFPEAGYGARFLAGFRRRRGPTVRYWSAEFEYLGADPVDVEPWPAWARRQVLRPLIAAYRLRWLSFT